MIYCKMLLHRCHQRNLLHDSRTKLKPILHKRYMRNWTKHTHFIDESMQRESLHWNCVLAHLLGAKNKNNFTQIIVLVNSKSWYHTTILFIGIISTIIVTITYPWTRYASITTIKLWIRTSRVSYNLINWNFGCNASVFTHCNFVHQTHHYNQQCDYNAMTLGYNDHLFHISIR